MTKAGGGAEPGPILCIIILILSLLTLGAREAGAQGAMLRWLGPDMEATPITLRFEAEYYPNTTVQAQGTALDINYQRFGALMPFWQDQKNQFLASLRLEHTHQSTEARLLDSDQPFPSSLANLQVGMHYRHKLNNGHIFGLSGAIGSPSDSMFSGGEVISYDLTMFWRVPTSKHGAALIMANYSNHRDYWNGIPTPGLAYYYKPDATLTGIFGWPFTRMVWEPNPRHKVDFFWRWPWNTRLQYTLSFTKALKMYGGFRWHNRRYFLEKKLKDGDQFFYWEKRVYLGVKAGLIDQVFLDFSVGYAFDRYYFQGESYDADQDDRVEVDNNYYIAGGLSGYF